MSTDTSPAQWREPTISGSDEPPVRKTMDRLPRSPPSLTCRTLKGDLYERRPDVTTAISAALVQPPTDWPSMAGAAGEGRLPSEAVVFLARCASSIDRDVFGRLAWEISHRAARKAQRWARGFDQTTTEEIIENVERTVTNLLLAETPSRQSEFLEVEFNTAVKHFTLKAVEKRRNAPLPLTAFQLSPDADDEDSERPTELVKDEGTQPDELAEELHDPVRRAALFRLARRAVRDHRHYEAFVLHHGFRWPLSTGDPAKPSLEQYFGRSERQIRNWITEAREAIHKAIGEEP